MQKLVRDFSVHPLLPGGLLTSLMEQPIAQSDKRLRKFNAEFGMLIE